MDYRGKLVAITGSQGFLGKKLAQYLEFEGAEVIELEGDVRDPVTFAELDHQFSYLFHFGAPSSQIMFKRNPAHCIETTMLGIINAANAAKAYGIRLVYPSTGLLSSDRYNEYAMGKKMSEDYVKGLNMDAVGIRIFATYGPGEGHKRDYASVPYLFMREAVAGRKFEVYGNGGQKRDFIYIEDTIEGILEIAERATEDVVDLGSGVATPFIDLISEIAKHVEVRHTLTDKPAGYVDETLATPNPYYSPEITIKEGIERMYKQLNEEK